MDGDIGTIAKYTLVHPITMLVFLVYYDALPCAFCPSVGYPTTKEKVRIRQSTGRTEGNNTQSCYYVNDCIFI